MRPRLVLVAHGTRDAAGPPVVEAIVQRVRRSLPGVDVVCSYVELVDPLLHDVLVGDPHPTVLVPLLLSTGYHVSVDLPRAAAAAPGPVWLTPPLGPDRRLAWALAERLREAGATAEDAVVLAAAGSSDPEGAADVRLMAGLLRDRWGPLVTPAFVTAASPRVDVAVRAAGQTARRVFAATYLIAPGFFATRLSDQAGSAGAVGVSEVLGAHRLLADLVRLRYLAAVAAVGGPPLSRAG